MKKEELLERLKGIQTVDSTMERLRINSAQAIYYLYRLRKEGYVKTQYGKGKKRIYYIGRENLIGGEDYLDIINKYAPLKVVSSGERRVYGRRISIEESLVWAVRSRKLRFILASLALFRQIRDWSKLYKLAKEERIVRQVGALYDLARLYVRKIKRIPKRFRKNGLPKKGDKYVYIIDNLRGEDFLDIEKKWKVYLPFNEEDLEEYR